MKAMPPLSATPPQTGTHFEGTLLIVCSQPKCQVTFAFGELRVPGMLWKKKDTIRINSIKIINFLVPKR